MISPTEKAGRLLLLSLLFSRMGTAVVLPAPTPLHENGEKLGYKEVDLMFQSQIWKMGCHMRKGIKATCKQGFSF